MGEKWDKKAILSIVFFVLGVVAVGLFVFGIFPESTMLVILGLLGFSGVGALRSFVDSHGWKTWFSALMGIIGSILEAFGVITPDQLALWLTTWGLIAGSGLVHAIAKAK